MKTYTVISVRDDSTYEPRHDYVQAESPSEAEQLITRAEWVVVAILAGRQVGL